MSESSDSGQHAEFGRVAREICALAGVRRLPLIFDSGTFVAIGGGACPAPGVYEFSGSVFRDGKPFGGRATSDRRTVYVG